VTLKERARQVFTIGIYLVVISVVLQFFLAGLGIFVSAELFFYHAAINGAIVFFLPVLLALVGWYAGVDRRTILLTLAITGLTLVQSLVLAPFHSAMQGPLRWISALHPLNAVFIFWVALHLMDRVRFPRTAPAR
jgi:uncharacterized protein DUF6220